MQVKKMMRRKETFQRKGSVTLRNIKKDSEKKAAVHVSVLVICQAPLSLFKEGDISELLRTLCT